VALGTDVHMSRQFGELIGTCASMVAAEKATESGHLHERASAISSPLVSEIHRHCDES
jgi:hypothetical protein